MKDKIGTPGRIREQLPKISKIEVGDVDDNHDLNRCVTIEPDYEAFKDPRDPYKNEKDCASVLLGFALVDQCQEIATKLKELYWGAEGGLRYIEAEELLDIMYEIRKMMSVFSEIEKIPTVVLPGCKGEMSPEAQRKTKGWPYIRKDYLPLYDEKDLFKRGILYEPLTFLKVAKLNDHRIPPELSFYEDESGELHWKNPYKNHGCNKTNKHEDLFFECIEIVQTFCQGFKDKGKQLASKTEAQDHLEKILKKLDKNFSDKSIVPDRMFRQIWKDIPNDLKRPTGETTKERQ